MKRYLFFVFPFLFLFSPVMAEQREEGSKLVEKKPVCRPRQPEGWCRKRKYRRLAGHILAAGIPLHKPGHASFALICGKKNTTIHVVLKPDDHYGRTLIVKSIYPFKIFGIQLSEIDKGYDSRLRCPVYSAAFYDMNKEPIYSSYIETVEFEAKDGTMKQKIKVRWWRRVKLTPSVKQQEFWFETI